jgi:hypothetical protein
MSLRFSAYYIFLSLTFSCLLHFPAYILEMPSRKVERKNRKTNRKVERKNRKTRKNRKQHGGDYSQTQSLAQGRQFASLHSAQHGGALLTGAPLSEIAGSSLPQELRSFARVGDLDASIAEASHQRDPDQMPTQTGGKRSRKTRKNRKTSRKNGKSGRKNRKSERKNRKSGRKSERKNRKSGRKSERKNRKSGRKSERKNRKSGRKSERKNRKSGRKSERKNRKSGRKSERKNRKSRRQGGGGLAGAPVGQATMLLSNSDAAKAGTADFSNPLLKN